MHFKRALMILSIFLIFCVASAKASSDPRCMRPQWFREFQENEKMFGGVWTSNYLVVAEENGKVLDFHGKDDNAVVCVSRTEPVSNMENGALKLHWLRIGQVHFSLKRLKGKAAHYKLTLKYGKIPQEGDSREYYRMFEDGGKLKIINAPRRFNYNKPYDPNETPLIIESSKLNRTYRYREVPPIPCGGPSSC